MATAQGIEIEWSTYNMKLCKYCGSEMLGEYTTNSRNSRRYTAFYNCTKCKAVCEGEYIDNKQYSEMLSERWFNPETKSFE